MNKNVQLSWTDLIDLLLSFQEDGDPEYRAYARNVLRNMAAFADVANETLPLLTRMTEVMQPDGSAIAMDDDLHSAMQRVLAGFAAIPGLPELPGTGQVKAA
jgi:hypothetical protein